MVLESFFFLSSNVCACHVLQIAKPLLPVTLICSLYIHTICQYVMHVFNQWRFFFFFNVATYKVISFYYKMFKEDLWIGRLKEQICISSHLDLETLMCTRGTNNPAVKTPSNHWSSLFLVQRQVPSTATIPSPLPHQKKKRALATRVKTRLNPDSLIQQQKN